MKRVDIADQHLRTDIEKQINERGPGFIWTNFSLIATANR
jgi:hypothetical protein